MMNISNMQDLNAEIKRHKKLIEEEKRKETNPLKRAFNETNELAYNIQRFEAKFGTMDEIIIKYRNSEQKDWIDSILQELRKIIFLEKKRLNPIAEDFRLIQIENNSISAKQYYPHADYIKYLRRKVDIFVKLQNEIWSPLIKALEWTSNRYVLNKVIDIISKNDFKLQNKMKFIPLRKEQVSKDIISFLICLDEKKLIKPIFKNNKFDYNRIHSIIDNIEQRSLETVIDRIKNKKPNPETSRAKIEYFHDLLKKI